MRLYLIRSIDIPPIEGIEFEDYDLVPTKETYKSTAEFFAHAKKNGAKYADREWLLLQEKNDNKVIELTETKQYDISFVAEKEKAE